MAKSNNQKAKILYLEKMLKETGEHHALSMQEILEILREYGISAERKSIYADVEVLRAFGMDIRYTRERPGGYYLYGNADIKEKPVRKIPASETEEAEPKSEPLQETRSVCGYEELLAASAKSIKREMKLLCAGGVQAEIRDYFGDNAEYKIKDSGDLMITAELPENMKFYGWLTGMGGSVRILKPRKSALAYRDYLKSLAREYKGL